MTNRERKDVFIRNFVSINFSVSEIPYKINFPYPWLCRCIIMCYLTLEIALHKSIGFLGLYDLARIYWLVSECVRNFPNNIFCKLSTKPVKEFWERERCNGGIAKISKIFLCLLIIHICLDWVGWLVRLFHNILGFSIDDRSLWVVAFIQYISFHV